MAGSNGPAPIFGAGKAIDTFNVGEKVMLKIGAGQAVRNFGRVHDAVKIPDLVAIQRRSYERFLQEDVPPTKRKRIGLESLFREIFPIATSWKGRVIPQLSADNCG
jgi:DNA-directed RNA polymerase beta subunit